MMLSYQGAGKYNMYLGKSIIVIDEEQIVELVTELLASKSNFEIPYIDDIKKRDEILKNEVSNLSGLLNEANEVNAKLENLLL